MREIKFRAQDFTHKWNYGFVAKGNESAVIFPVANDGTVFLDIQIEVLPDTIGQYTGMHDKNGKEIYEGDILDVIVFDCFGNDEQYMVHVEWFGTEFMGVDVTNDEHVWNLCWLCSQDDEIDVIGNTYDNKDLLNENKKI